MSDNRGNVTSDFISVRQLLDEAGAFSKKRKGLNQRVGNALRNAALTRQPPVPLRRCLHSNVWLFPVDFAKAFMESTGNSWVQAHNEKVAGQGVLKFPPQRRKSGAGDDQPGAGA